jgi:hypothetical protein
MPEGSVSENLGDPKTVRFSIEIVTIYRVDGLAGG